MLPYISIYLFYSCFFQTQPYFFIFIFIFDEKLNAFSQKQRIVGSLLIILVLNIYICARICGCVYNLLNIIYQYKTCKMLTPWSVCVCLYLT
ncbi:hypothetical protein F4703DRAFT_1526103 [Phycomyces blakesleeanus]